MQNISKVYGVRMGITLLSVHSTKEKAQQAASLIQPVQIGSDAYDDFKPLFQYAYIVEHQPGEIVGSEMYPGYGYLKMSNGKDEYDSQPFDYVNLSDIEMGNPALARPKSV